MTRWIQDDVYEHDGTKPMVMKDIIGAAREPTNSQKGLRVHGGSCCMLTFPKLL